MTAPTFSIGDRVLFATGCSVTKAQYGIAPHRADVAQLVSPAVVTDVYEKKGSWPLAVRLADNSTLVTVPGELTVIEKAAAVSCDQQTEPDVAPAARMEAAA